MLRSSTASVGRDSIASFGVITLASWVLLAVGYVAYVARRSRFRPERSLEALVAAAYRDTVARVKEAQ